MSKDLEWISSIPDKVAMTIDIDIFLEKVASAIKGKKVPVVDLIAVQTKDPYKVLVATILSARTKDETTAKPQQNSSRKLLILRPWPPYPRRKFLKQSTPLVFITTRLATSLSSQMLWHPLTTRCQIPLKNS